MRDTRFDTRSSEWIGDLSVWLYENSDDNSEQLSRLKRNLRTALKSELTPRQREILELCFFHNMNLTQIAQKLHRNKSTVSRTAKRAKDRLRRVLRYSF